MELARSMVSRLRQIVGDRRNSRRYKVRLALTVFVTGAAKSLNGSSRVVSLAGHTLDVSEHGLALILPSIRLGEHHLVGENRGFTVRLQLPDGPVDMQVAPVRYENLDEHSTETGFLIGVKITQMSDVDRTQFAEYVASKLPHS